MNTTATIYDLSAARAMALFNQHLVDPDQRPKDLATGGEIYQTVRDLGCVQIDTLHVVHRSHYLVLWSRLGNYNPSELDRLIYEPDQRRLFEGWQHATSIIPLEDYRYQIPHMRYVHQNPAEMSVKWLAEPGSKDLLQFVRERIADQGPMRAKDFEYDGPKRGSWWDWKPAKNALEHLLAWGELMIADRVNFQRVYDLRKRVLPDWVETSEPTPEIRDRYWLEQGVRALGICQPVQAADYSYRKRNSVRNTIGEMINEGLFLEVEVRMFDGSIKSHIIHHQDKQLLEKAADGMILPRRTTFLSPFDNLFWARGRDKQFWKFRNLLEAYKPAPTRIWGYFNMPILHHDRLVGKIDPKMDRKDSRLIVKSIYLEEGIEPDEDLVADIAQTFRSFMKFHQAHDLEFERSQPAELGVRISAQI
jgi:uncharacterized protein YcaQ